MLALAAVVWTVHGMADVNTVDQDLVDANTVDQDRCT